MKHNRPFLDLLIGLMVAVCLSMANAGQKQTKAKNSEQQREAPAADQALTDCRRATEALRGGDFDTAKEALDRALLSMNACLAGTKDAKKARNAFHKESVKAFIGEPYERAMANFYRGIIYWKDGEVDNARACFRTAQLHDTSNEEATRCDFVILDYLDGLANALTGADPQEALNRAKANSSIELPAYNAKANVLVFLETGTGPTKFAEGDHKEHLAYRPGSSPVESLTVALAGTSVATKSWDDLTHQAMTRGDRVMDQILTKKSNIKTGTDTVGNASVVAGAATAVAGGDGRVAAGLAAFGLASKVVAASVKPEADTRCWDTLPQNLAFAALQAAPGEHKLSVKFLDKSQNIIAEKEIDIRLETDGKPVVLLVKD